MFDPLQISSRFRQGSALEMYWVSTFGPANCQTLKIYRGSSKRRVKLTAASAIADLEIGKQEMQSLQYFQRSRPSQSPGEQTSTVDRDRLFEPAASFPASAIRDAASEN